MERRSEKKDGKEGDGEGKRKRKGWRDGKIIYMGQKLLRTEERKMEKREKRKKRGER